MGDNTTTGTGLKDDILLQAVDERTSWQTVHIHKAANPQINDG